jgi:hypothetical protein
MAGDGVMILSATARSLIDGGKERNTERPLGKGSYGGFALDLREGKIQAKQKQIPLNPPFPKGEADASTCYE